MKGLRPEVATVLILLSASVRIRIAPAVRPRSSALLGRAAQGRAGTRGLIRKQPRPMTRRSTAGAGAPAQMPGLGGAAVHRRSGPHKGQGGSTAPNLPPVMARTAAVDAYVEFLEAKRKSADFSRYAGQISGTSAGPSRFWPCIRSAPDPAAASWWPALRPSQLRGTRVGCISWSASPSGSKSLGTIEVNRQRISELNWRISIVSQNFKFRGASALWLAQNFSQISCIEARHISK